MKGKNNMDKEWQDYSSNFAMKVEDDFVEGLKGMEDLLTNGGVFLREAYENAFEFTAVVIQPENKPVVSHGTVDLNDYRDNEAFIEYAESEGMTIDELIETGTNAASWILEQDIGIIAENEMPEADVYEFLMETGIFDSFKTEKEETKGIGD